MQSVFDKIYTRVCHVTHGYEDRRAHIVREFSALGVPIDFYLDFDIPDLSRDLVDTSSLSPPLLSIACKHIGIWREFLASGKPYCLVFEDDVFLAPDFVSKLTTCLEEFGDPTRLAAVYLGNGCNYYIAQRLLKQGQHLYRAERGRCLDSYLITRPVAEARLSWFERNRMTQPIDHQTDIADAEIGVEVLWFERPIVEQGSQNGAFLSSLQPDTRPLWRQKVWWLWRKIRRRIGGRRPGPLSDIGKPEKVR